MSKKAVRSISVDPQFYAQIEELAKNNRVAVSIIVEEALKEAISGKKSSFLNTILKREVRNG